MRLTAAELRRAQGLKGDGWTIGQIARRLQLSFERVALGLYGGNVDWETADDFEDGGGDDAVDGGGSEGLRASAAGPVGLVADGGGQRPASADPEAARRRQDGASAVLVSDEPARPVVAGEEAPESAPEAAPPAAAGAAAGPIASAVEEVGPAGAALAVVAEVEHVYVGVVRQEGSLDAASPAPSLTGAPDEAAIDDERAELLQRFHPARRFSLRSPDGQWLHELQTTLTRMPKFFWRGTAEQVAAIKRRNPRWRGLVPVAVK